MKYFIALFLLVTFQAFAEPLPPLPPSLVDTITVPVGDIELRELYFKTGSEELKDADQKYIDELFSRIKDMSLYVVIKAYTDSVGDADTNLKLSRRRADFVKTVISKTTGWAGSHFLTFGYGEKYSNSGSNEKERRVEITLLAPKAKETEVVRMRQEIRAKGINVQDFTAIPKGTNTGAEEPKLNKYQGEKEVTRKFYANVGLLFGGGKNSKSETNFSRTGLQLGLRYIHSDFVQVQFLLKTINSTYKKDGDTVFATGSNLTTSLYLIKKLHKVVSIINGFGLVFQQQAVKKTDSNAIMLPFMNSEIIQTEAQGFLYEFLFEFYPPRYALQPHIGFDLQFLPDSFYAGPVVGFRFRFY